MNGNGNGARPDVWAADTEAPRARILELEREVARLAETNAAHSEAHALMAARLERAQVDIRTVCERAEEAEQQVAALEARLAVTVPMLPVETLYRSVPIDTQEHAEQIPADALLRFSPPRALVPLVAHRQQGSGMVNPEHETAPSASAYRYTTAWQEPHA